MVSVRTFSVETCLGKIKSRYNALLEKSHQRSNFRDRNGDRIIIKEVHCQNVNSIEVRPFFSEKYFFLCDTKDVSVASSIFWS
jgi:hypothetical protein